VLRHMLKSKIHRCCVTESNLNYNGSLSIDKKLLHEAHIFPYEHIEIYNVSNGNRFSTYAQEGEENSGTICANGAAARLCYPGDIIIVAAYALVSEEDMESFHPHIVFVDSENKSIKCETATINLKEDD
jgi:aspartate 1-decarboxylase